MRILFVVGVVVGIAVALVVMPPVVERSRNVALDDAPTTAASPLVEDGEDGATGVPEDDAADDAPTSAESDEMVVGPVTSPDSPDGEATDPDLGDAPAAGTDGPDAGAAAPPEETTVQILDGAGDGDRVEDAEDVLRDLGYDIVHVDRSSREYEVTTILYTAGHEDEANALRDRDPRFAEVREAPDNLDADVHLHIVVGTDWPR